MTKHKSTTKGRTSAKEHKKKKSKPKRPLSAYNLFFQQERKKILLEALQHDGELLSPEEIAHALKTGKDRPHRKSHGKISFVGLVKQVAAKWNTLPSEEKQTYEVEAKEEQRRYQMGMEAWKKTQEVNNEEVLNETVLQQKPSSLQVSGGDLNFPRPLLVASLGHAIYRGELSLPVSLNSATGNTGSAGEMLVQGARLPLEPDCYPSTSGSMPDRVGSQARFLSNISTLASQLDDDCYELLSSFRNQPAS